MSDPLQEPFGPTPELHYPQEPTPAEQRVLDAFMRSYGFPLWAMNSQGWYYRGETIGGWAADVIAALREYGAEQRAAGMREAEALAQQWGFTLTGADDD